MILELKNTSDIPFVAQEFLENFGHNSVFAFDGEMGVGKTTFITGLLTAMGIEEIDGSPTYSIVNSYQSLMFGKVYHLDVYRLNDESEAMDFGIEEMFYSGSICLVEWPEKIKNLLPDNTIWVYIRKKEDNTRIITIEQ